MLDFVSGAVLYASGTAVEQKPPLLFFSVLYDLVERGGSSLEWDIVVVLTIMYHQTEPLFWTFK